MNDSSEFNCMDPKLRRVGSRAGETNGQLLFMGNQLTRTLIKSQDQRPCVEVLNPES